MDSGWKLTLATIAGAIITAGGAIYAAHIGLLKPSDAQVSRSTQFQEILESSNRQLSEIAKLKEALSEQEADRKRITQEAELQKSRLEALEAKQAAAVIERSRDNQTTDARLLLSQPISKPTTTQSPQITRQKLVLTQGKPAILWESTTVTLDYANNYAKLIINGVNYRWLRVGSRIALGSPSGQECAFEVIELNGAGVPGESITLDLVCKRRA